MSVVNWLFTNKPPRSKKRCDYCNTTRFGLARPNFTFCSPRCFEAFNEAIFRPPDQFELPLFKPPDTMPSN